MWTKLKRMICTPVNCSIGTCLIALIILISQQLSDNTYTTIYQIHPETGRGLGSDHVVNNLREDEDPASELPMSFNVSNSSVESNEVCDLMSAVKFLT